MINAATVPNRITGSASMNIGIVPDVRLTMLDEKTTRATPEVRMTSALDMLFIFKEIAYKTRQNAALAKGYRSNTILHIEPLAFPSRS